jgi:hypothetical protein
MHRSRLAPGLLLAGLPLAGLLITTGCIRSKTLAVVKPDGSGYVVLSQITASPNEYFGGSYGRPERDIKQHLEDLAETLGDGVTLARSEELKGKGFAAVFAFTNISTVTLPLLSFGPMAGMDTDMLQEGPSIFRESIGFGFARTNESQLTVRLPDSLVSALTAPADSPAGDPDDDADPSFLQQVQGLNLEIAVRIQGRITSHTASQPDATETNRFILFRLDGSGLADRPELLQSLMGSEPDSPGEMDSYFANFLRAAGATAETNRTASIRFSNK